MNQFDPCCHVQMTLVAMETNLFLLSEIAGLLKKKLNYLLLFTKIYFYV